MSRGGWSCALSKKRGGNGGRLGTFWQGWICMCAQKNRGVDRCVCVWLRVWAKPHMHMQEKGRVGECTHSRKNVIVAEM